MDAKIQTNCTTYRKYVFYCLMPLLLTIPTRISDNFGDPINLLKGYVSQIANDISGAPIHVDFSSTRFTSPFVLAGLSALVDRFNSRGIEVIKNPNITNYLDTINFPSGIYFQYESLDQIEQRFATFQGKTYIPLLNFPAGKSEADNKTREKTLSAIHSLLKHQVGLSGQMFMAIAHFIDELTNNVSDHSGADSGKIFAQYYPSKNYLDLCIVDSGKGLQQSYLNSGKFNPQTDEEAIDLALNGRSTKPDAITRGFGIPSSRRMLKEGLRGRFYLWTGNASFYEDAERTEILSFPTSYRWKGCFIALRIPTQNIANFNIYTFVERG